jgi:hypothetical protein
MRGKSAGNAREMCGKCAASARETRGKCAASAREMRGKCAGNARAIVLQIKHVKKCLHLVYQIIIFHLQSSIFSLSSIFRHIQLRQFVHCFLVSKALQQELVSEASVGAFAASFCRKAVQPQANL